MYANTQHLTHKNLNAILQEQPWHAFYEVSDELTLDTLPRDEKEEPSCSATENVEATCRCAVPVCVQKELSLSFASFSSFPSSSSLRFPLSNRDAKVHLRIARSTPNKINVAEGHLALVSLRRCKLEIYVPLVSKDRWRKRVHDECVQIRSTRMCKRTCHSVKKDGSTRFQATAAASQTR